MGKPKGRDPPDLLANVNLQNNDRKNAGNHFMI